MQGLKESEKLKHGELNLIIGNGRIMPFTRIKICELMFDGGVRIYLINCCYLSDMTRNIISFHTLFRKGFRYTFNNNGTIFVYKNGVLFFKAYPCNEMYEIVGYVNNMSNGV